MQKESRFLFEYLFYLIFYSYIFLAKTHVIVNIIILYNSVETIEQADGEPSQSTSDTEIKKDIETEKKEDPNVEISTESTAVAAGTTESESSREPTTDSTDESPLPVNQSPTEAETSHEPTNVDTDNSTTSESTPGA